MPRAQRGLLLLIVFVMGMLVEPLESTGRGRRKGQEGEEEMIYRMAEEARDTVSHTLSEMFSSKPNDHEVKKTQPRPHDTSLIKASISCRQMDVDACERISNEARKESSHLGQIWLSMAKKRAKEVEKRLEGKEQRRRSETKKEKDLASMYLHQASLAQSQADLEGEEVSNIYERLLSEQSSKYEPL